jgi:hypothetical protein
MRVYVEIATNAGRIWRIGCIRERASPTVCRAVPEITGMPKGVTACNIRFTCFGDMRAIKPSRGRVLAANDLI